MNRYMFHWSQHSRHDTAPLLEVTVALWAVHTIGLKQLSGTSIRSLQKQHNNDWNCRVALQLLFYLRFLSYGFSCPSGWMWFCFLKDFLYRSMEYIYQELFACCIRYCMYCVCVGDCLLGDLLL